jgi:serine/threonine protein kinase
LLQGAFGEAFLAVRRRDLYAHDGKTLKIAGLDVTCSQELFVAPVRKSVIKRCLPAVHESSRVGRGDAKQRFSESFAAFNDERRQRAAHVADELRQAKDGFRHIVEYFKDVKDYVRGAHAMVFEWCNGGDLLHLLKRLPSGERLPVDIVVHICWQVASALATLHNAAIIHGDVALRNVFLHVDEKAKEFAVKLGDFGVSEDLADLKVAMRRPTYSMHVAPEVDRMTPHSYASDVYSFGVVLNELLTGKLFTDVLSDSSRDEVPQAAAG